MDRIPASERTRERLKSLIEGPWRGERFALRTGARRGLADRRGRLGGRSRGRAVTDYYARGGAWRLADLRFPLAHRRAIRTTNLRERGQTARIHLYRQRLQLLGPAVDDLAQPGAERHRAIGDLRRGVVRHAIRRLQSTRAVAVAVAGVVRQSGDGCTPTLFLAILRLQRRQR
jgi:hypothetical protein